MSRTIPIILVHSIARFDILSEMVRQRLRVADTEFDDDNFQYFKGIKTHLESHELAPVFHPNHDFAGGVNMRARQLRNNVVDVISQTGARKVHIIAHSMGGLDARHMIVDFGMADKVASLTTIGTPHLGTVLADHVISRGGDLLMEFLKKAVKLDLEGFHDLTVSACSEFNRRVEDAEAKNAVLYQTFASSQDFKQMFTPLIPSWLFIRESEGRNDGLVSFSSQQWKSELIALDGTRKTITQKEFRLPADHLNQIGWWDLSEATLFGETFSGQKNDYEDKIKNIYLEIARNL